MKEKPDMKNWLQEYNINQEIEWHQKKARNEKKKSRKMGRVKIKVKCTA